MSEWYAGSLHGLVWPDGFALIDGGVPLPAVTELWQAAPNSLGDFLATLSRVSGGDVRRLPRFTAAVRAGAGWRVAVAGTLWAEIGQASGLSRVELNPGDIWTERPFEQATSVRLGSPALPPNAGTGWRPITSAVVPAEALRWAEVQRTPRRARDGAPDVVPERVEHGPATQPIPAPMAQTSPAPAAQAPAPAPAAPANPTTATPGGSTTREPSGVPGDFGHLWGDTILGDPARLAATPDPSAPPSPARPTPTPVASPAAETNPFLPPPTPAPAPPAAPAPAGPAPAHPSQHGDHDGHTILAARPQTPAPPPPPGTATLLAVLCPNQHPNPPERPSCRICSAPIQSAPVQVPRPSLGTLRFSNGATIELTQPLLFGRQPRANQHRGTDLPRLVPLPFDHISGNHLQISLEGWTVLARDLNSTNGTYLRRPGEPLVRLPERPLPLRSGDVLDLGHGVRIILEELP